MKKPRFRFWKIREDYYVCNVRKYYKIIRGIDENLKKIFYYVYVGDELLGKFKKLSEAKKFVKESEVLE